MGNLAAPGRMPGHRHGKLARMMRARARRLDRWYRYIKRNKRLGAALSVLFGALELAIVEAVRLAARLVPSAEPRFMRLLDGKWGSKIIPLNVPVGDVTTGILPSQQILEIARRVPIRSLNWCYCYRKHGQETGESHPDRYTCLAMGWGQNLDAINALAAKDPAKKVSPTMTVEDVERKLREWNEQGYVHQAIFFPSPDYFYIICACHPDFCLTLANQKKWGFPSVVKADFVISKDDAACTSCGRCAGRCHFGAMTVDVGEGGMVSCIPAACAGCGLCVATCPAEALTLVPRQAGLAAVSRP